MFVTNIESSDYSEEIRACQTALKSLARDQNPESWAKLQKNLANYLALGDNSNDTELIIKHCQLAFEIFTPESFPEDWADIQQILGFSYQKRALKDAAQNVEQGIFHYELALQVKTLETLPYDWAVIHMNLGEIYRHRVLGNKSENIEFALQCSQLALTVFSPEVYPIEWASVQHNLGTIHFERIQGNKAHNIEQAIECFHLSLRKFDFDRSPFEWAREHHGLAAAYLHRIHGARAENFEQAIYHCQLAFNVYTKNAYPSSWAGLQLTLANTYLARIYGIRSDNIERASKQYRFALQVFTRNAHPVHWAAIQRGLANAFLIRRAGEPDANIKQAIYHCQLALTVTTRETSPIDWARNQNTLAIAYVNLANLEQGVNIEQAIHHYELALEVYVVQGLEIDASLTYFNLGNIYCKWIDGNHIYNINKAIYYFELALKIQEANSLHLEQLATKRSLGKLYFDMRNWVKSLDASYEAIKIGNTLLGIAYSELGRKAEIELTAKLYEQAAYCLVQLERYKEAFLLLEEGKARLLTEVMLLEDADLTNLSPEENHVLRTAQQKVRSLEGDMRFYAGLIVNQNDRELSQQLNDARQELATVITSLRSAHSDFMPVNKDLTNITNLVSEGQALVIPLITSQGSVVFLLQHKSETIIEEDIVRLDTFRDIELNKLLIGNQEDPGLLTAYISAFHQELQQLNKFSKDNWKSILERVTQVLWEKFLVFIHQKLIQSNIKHIILIPSGGLQFLPLHAAWTKSDGQLVYLLDYYEVTYSPSVYTLSVCSRRATTPRGKDALVIGVNEYVNFSSLTTSVNEAKGVADQLGVHALIDNQATKSALIEGMNGKAYLHLSCHGLYAWQDGPLNSALYLAEDEPFSLLELLSENIDLTSARLVTLSACESGISDIHQLSNEYIGFPTGFLQAGAPAVISTLWSVDESSTAVLMARFYEKHIDHGLPISQALREAQIWLRDITRKDLGIYLKKKGTKEALIAYNEIMLEGHLTDRLYSHPFYWAAFTFFGS